MIWPLIWERVKAWWPYLALVAAVLLLIAYVRQGGELAAARGLATSRGAALAAAQNQMAALTATAQASAHTRVEYRYTGRPCPDVVVDTDAQVSASQAAQLQQGQAVAASATAQAAPAGGGVAWWLGAGWQPIQGGVSAAGGIRAGPVFLGISHPVPGVGNAAWELAPGIVAGAAW